MTELISVSVDSEGRTYFDPVIAKVGGVSQYKGSEFYFQGIEGYWDFSRTRGMNGTLPVIGSWYKVELTTKPKQPGPNTKEGSLYYDVRQARLAHEDEIPAQEAQNGSQSQPRLKREDGQEIFRTKEELRWTEALHMAIARRSDEPNYDNLLDVANWFYQVLQTGPDIPLDGPEKPVHEDYEDNPPPAQEEDIF
jgi:hypothetical protein